MSVDSFHEFGSGTEERVLRKGICYTYWDRIGETQKDVCAQKEAEKTENS